MEYTLYILLLPFLSFLLLGICGKWFSHRLSGLIGTCSLLAVTALSYLTAYEYFTMPRLADGTFERIPSSTKDSTSTSASCSTRYQS